MSKINTAYEMYRDDGMQALATGSLAFLARQGVFSGRVESLLGKELIERTTKYHGIGYWPQVKDPRSFNEKIMHRKLYTNNPVYSELEDKWTVRDYVRQNVSDEILAEVYHVTDDPDTIPFEELPSEFVVKSSNGSGEVILVDDKQEANFASIRAQCRDWLSSHHGENNHEYWYEDIKPRILIEEYLHDKDYDIPLDYKFYVFHGTVEYIHVDFNRFSGLRRRFYDRDWNEKEFQLGYPLAPVIDEPENLSEMIDIAEALAEGFDFLRVDLYNIDGEDVVFGEITIAPGSGSTGFTPVEYDFKLGSLW